MILNILDIIGLKIVAVKGHITDRRYKRCITPVYILFSDQETYIELEDQDYYTFHDCDIGAKNIRVRKDKRLWSDIFNNKDGYYPNVTIT